jgi:hypothetical protein
MNPADRRANPCQFCKKLDPGLQFVNAYNEVVWVMWLHFHRLLSLAIVIRPRAL